MVNPQVAEPPKPLLQMVNLTIDGKPVAVPKGANVILAAKKLGIHIPHYCYHEKLSIPGNCRMCLIEMGTPEMTPDHQPVLKPDGTPKISWIPRPQIGCTTTVGEGMAIRTDSKMVEECRKGVMEFLLINHPLDCPICDQAGECLLQEYSVEYGNGVSRFIEEKVHKPKKVQLGPRVLLDDERCVMCSRCVRFCQEIAKDDVLGFMNRGSHTTLGCHPGRQLENNYSLNTVDICPVGALTSTDFRFKMRVWFLKETKSICTSCSTGCNIIVGSREGVVHRYTPRRNDSVNSDWMCDWGRLQYKWINDKRRLGNPLKKDLECRTKKLALAVDLPIPLLAKEGLGEAPCTQDLHPSDGTIRGSFIHTEIEWDTAFRRCREILKSARNQIAIVASGRCSTEELYLLKRIATAYGARVTDIIPRSGEADGILMSADRNPNTNGARLMGLTGASPGSQIMKIRKGVDRGEIKVLLVVAECAVKAGIPEETLQKLDALISIDTLPNRTTGLADFVLPGATHVEKRGTFINGRKRIQRFQQAFPPKGETRADWEILKGLLPITQTDDFNSFEGLFKEMCNQTPALNGLTWNEIGDEGMDLSAKF